MSLRRINHWCPTFMHDPPFQPPNNPIKYSNVYFYPYICLSVVLHCVRKVVFLGQSMEMSPLLLFWRMYRFNLWKACVWRMTWYPLIICNMTLELPLESTRIRCAGGTTDKPKQHLLCTELWCCLMINTGRIYLTDQGKERVRGPWHSWAVRLLHVTVICLSL